MKKILLLLMCFNLLLPPSVAQGAMRRAGNYFYSLTIGDGGLRVGGGMNVCGDSKISGDFEVYGSMGVNSLCIRENLSVGGNLHLGGGDITSAGTKLSFGANGICLNGAVSATTYYGDGSNLSGVAGGVAWDDITNPDANDEINFADYIIELKMGSSGDFRIGDGGSDYVKFADDGDMSFAGGADINLPNDSVDSTDVNFNYAASGSEAGPATDFGLTSDADAGDLDILSIDKLEGVDNKVFADLGLDGYFDIDADVAIRLFNDGTEMFTIGSLGTCSPGNMSIGGYYFGESRPSVIRHVDITDHYTELFTDDDDTGWYWDDAKKLRLHYNGNDRLYFDLSFNATTFLGTVNIHNEASLKVFSADENEHLEIKHDDNDAWYDTDGTNYGSHRFSLNNTEIFTIGEVGICTPFNASVGGSVFIGADLYVASMKTGTDQNDAGAAKGELWAESDNSYIVYLGQ